MATYKYYQPNEVIFREGWRVHQDLSEGDQHWTESGEKYQLKDFFAIDGDVPDKGDHDLYFLDTTVKNSGDGDNSTSNAKAQTREVVALFKSDKPVSVDYKYIMNAPKIKVKDYGLHFESLFSLYARKEKLTNPEGV